MLRITQITQHLLRRATPSTTSNSLRTGATVAVAAARPSTTTSIHARAFSSTTSPSMSIPKTQQALQIHKQGGTEANEMHEIPVPELADGQILVQVEWAGVNYIDTYLRGGLYPKPVPFVLGMEPAGVVVSSKSSRFSEGDRVSAYLTTGGGYAQYVAVDDSKAVKLSPSVSTRDAAGLVLQGLTAWTLCKEAYAVQRGDTILVHAAAGGVGLLLCQMIRHLGAHAIGTVSTQEKAELARANGAEHVILYGPAAPAGETVVDRVLEITNGQGVQAVFDGVGKDTWEDDFKVIARKGTIATFGNASGAVDPFPPLKLSAKNVKVCRPTLGNYVATRDELETYTSQLWELVAQGAVKLKVHKEYPFSAEGIKQSQVDITSRGTTGKLLIKVKP